MPRKRSHLCPSKSSAYMHAKTPTNYVPASCATAAVAASFMLLTANPLLIAYRLSHMLEQRAVAIGLINHNVTYLLSSESPALRNGHYRPMPFRAGSPARSAEPPIPPVDVPSPTINSAPRSRSNSYVSATGTLAAGQRVRAEIKEEQDTWYGTTRKAKIGYDVWSYSKAPSYLYYWLMHDIYLSQLPFLGVEVFTDLTSWYHEQWLGSERWSNNCLLFFN